MKIKITSTRSPIKNLNATIQNFQLSMMNTDDSNIDKHKLSQYSDHLNKINNQTFIDKLHSWFSIVNIILIVLLHITCYGKGEMNLRTGIASFSNDGYPLSQLHSRIADTLGKLFPRPSVHVKILLKRKFSNSRHFFLWRELF